MGNRMGLLLTGLVIGLLALVLTKLGNPANMGICVACFLRDTAGGIGLHKAKLVQYIRPEILGIALGSFALSVGTREFRAIGGSNRILRFVLGFVMMAGMLVFLGCPLRVALRLGAGDLNALTGLAGLFVGAGVGTMFLKSGFSFGRAVAHPKPAGAVLPLAAVIMLAFLVLKPSFIFFSTEGPASNHAPVLISLGAGLIIGMLAQRSRFCMAGGIRDAILFRNFNLIFGFLVIILVTLAGSLVLGTFKPGFSAQPIAHTEALWNFLGLAVAGWAAVLLGGCPLRQLVLAGQGNTDSAITVAGLITGASLAHRYGFAASAKGVPAAGQIAVVAAIVVLLAVSVAFYFKAASEKRRNAGVNC